MELNRVETIIYKCVDIHKRWKVRMRVSRYVCSNKYTGLGVTLGSLSLIKQRSWCSDSDSDALRGRGLVKVKVNFRCSSNDEMTVFLFLGLSSV